MISKTIVNVFPRDRYPATASGRVLVPRNRARLEPLFGSAVEVWFYTRVYARDTNVFLDFDLVHGCLGDQSPADALRSFALTRSGASPSLPYDTTNMATLPDDGVFYVNPKMGLTSILAKLYNAAGSIEFETWATVISSQ